MNAQEQVAARLHRFGDGSQQQVALAVEFFHLSVQGLGLQVGCQALGYGGAVGGSIVFQEGTEGRSGPVGLVFGENVPGQFEQILGVAGNGNALLCHEKEGLEEK